MRDGDEWIVNGQKVWTTYGHESELGMLLARTDPGVAKHQGITYFVVDMHASGVEIRPLVQMTGEHEFNEVFLTDVRIPDLLRISPVGDGWGAAQTTLQAERFALSGARRKRRARDEILGRQDRRRRAGPGGTDTGRSSPALRDVRRDRTVEELVRSRRPGPHLAAVPDAGLGPSRRSHRLDHQDRQGLGQPVAAAGWRSSSSARPVRRGRPTTPSSPGFVRELLRTRANSIEGGTSEIQRNIVGERVLGLPREPDPWKGVAWKEVPRS